MSVCILISTSDAPYYVVNAKRPVLTNAYSPHPYVSMIKEASQLARRASIVIKNVYFWTQTIYCALVVASVVFLVYSN